jgi:glutathione S-transferase
MKLYGTLGACSLAAHIALHEAGLPFDYVMVDLRSRKLADGRDLTEVNTKDYVPVLELDDGQRLTEVAVVLQYIADQAPAKCLIPAAGTLSRYRVQEWLSFVSSELHKAFGPLFMPGASDEAKAQAVTSVMARLTWVDQQLVRCDFLVGERFTVADIYLFVAASWTQFVGIDIPALTHLAPYLGRIAARPAVQAAMRAEGLLK